MAVHIKKIDDRNYLVNGKPIIRDTSSSWIGQIEMTQFEREAFYKHIINPNNDLDLPTDHQPDCDSHRGDHDLRRAFTPKKLKQLGFVHYYDSDIEDAGTAGEFSYSVYKIDIRDSYLEATIEYGANKQPRLVEFNIDGTELTGRDLTAHDIKILKEIL